MEFTDLGCAMLERGVNSISFSVPDKGVIFADHYRGDEVSLSFVYSWNEKNFLATVYFPFCGSKVKFCDYVEKQLRGHTFAAFLHQEDVVAGSYDDLNFIPLRICPVILPAPLLSPNELKAEAKRQRRAQKRLAVAHG